MNEFPPPSSSESASLGSPPFDGWRDISGRPSNPQPQSSLTPPPPPPSLDDASKESERRGGSARRRVGVGVVLLLMAVGGGVAGALIVGQLDGGNTTTVVTSGEAGSPQIESTSVPAQPTSVDQPLPSGMLDVAGIAAKTGPSTVTISADIEEAQMIGASVGTGVIISADGEILTNAHVVEGASEIRVRLNGETEPTLAELSAVDVGNDLALLRVEKTGLTPVEFATPDSIKLGDQVVAIGFALDLDGAPSVTVGVVSALNRTLAFEEDTFLDGLIQTDAAISSGNSGGPLVNGAGQLVGINTAVARSNMFTAASNVGFAISVGEVEQVLAELREQTGGGEPRSDAYFGVGLSERIDGGQGALVATVEAGTPAAKAGIREGDVVVAVDGVAIDGSGGLIAAIRDREPGDMVSIAVLRNGEPVTVDVELVEYAPEDG